MPHQLPLEERQAIVNRILATEDEDERNRLRALLVVETDNSPEEGDDASQEPVPDLDEHK